MSKKKIVEVIGQELTNIVNVYGLVYKVPAKYNWLTIDCLGEMFAFEEKPVLDEEDGRWWCDKEDFRGGRFIGEFYENPRYYKTLHYIGSGKEKVNSQMSFKNHGRLICKEVELFGWMGYIPDEFNYITIDENLGITAWKEQPEYIKGSWENGGSFTFVGWIPKDSEEPIDFEECLFELK